MGEGCRHPWAVVRWVKSTGGRKRMEYQIYKLTEKEQRVLDKLEIYLDELWYSPRIHPYTLNPNNDQVEELSKPQIVVSETCGFDIGGQTWYYSLSDSVIEISSWILYDIKEAKATLRHELAHVIKEYLEFEGGIHGSGFTKALKIVSNRTWRRDRHWKNSLPIEKARVKVHPKIQIEFGENRGCD